MNIVNSYINLEHHCNISFKVKLLVATMQIPIAGTTGIPYVQTSADRLGSVYVHWENLYPPGVQQESEEKEDAYSPWSVSAASLYKAPAPPVCVHALLLMVS